MTFHDRTTAGRLLAEHLDDLVTPSSILAALSRGGVAVALPVSERFGVPLAMTYVSKLAAPAAPELALGAIDEEGVMLVDTGMATALALAPEDVEAARQRAETDIRRRMAEYLIPPLSRYAPGHAVVLVDEGIATGLTMRAAVAYARRHGARHVAVAVPCASAAAIRRLRPEVDRLVALVVDQHFSAVGDYYGDFRPLGDDEVARMLARAAEHVRSPSS